MKKFWFVVLALLSVSGCATFDGLVTDVNRLSMRASKLGNVQSPADVCEPIYKNEGVSSRYHQCLEDRLMAQASPDKWQFGKTYPECKKIYRSNTGKWNKYRSCQEDAYRKYVVLPEVRQIVQWRRGASLRRNER